MAENSRKILIIDDNSDYLFTMETFLSRNGFTVVTADDGEKGLELIRKENPDLVLLDVMMTSLYSGFEVCRQMKNDPKTRDIPIIGISGMKDELGVQFDLNRDAEYFSPNTFFDKPVDKQALLKCINNLLAESTP